jgi:hypothetical protein
MTQKELSSPATSSDETHFRIQIFFVFGSENFVRERSLLFGCVVNLCLQELVQLGILMQSGRILYMTVFVVRFYLIEDHL